MFLFNFTWVMLIISKAKNTGALLPLMTPGCSKGLECSKEKKVTFNATFRHFPNTFWVLGMIVTAPLHKHPSCRTPQTRMTL